tara:strand:+ start:693 stop:1157 length:465 start_codon:yes stop_codon:yes gene_type:complete
MAFKLKGSSFYGSSPFKQKKKQEVVPKPKKSTTTAHGQMNDAAAEYETDKRLYEEYLRNKKANEQEKKEDEAGVGSGSNKKVMKDGSKNKVHGLKKGDTWTNPNAKKSDFQKKVDAKKKKYDNATPEERKKMQDAANDKADKFHKRGKYKENKK